MSETDYRYREAPFKLPPESVEIILDIPKPPSANRIWRSALRQPHGSNLAIVYKSKEYVSWIKQAGLTLVVNGQLPKDNKIIGPFEISVYVARAARGDLDNHLKSLLDFLQTHNIIADDRDCQKVRMEWVPEAEAPLGCRVHLRSLHE